MLVLRVGRKAHVNSLAFAPDGRALAAVCDGGTLHYWREIADGAVAASLTSRATMPPRFTADGRWLFSGHQDLWRFDPATGADAAFGLWGGYPSSFDVAPTAPHVLAAQGYHANGENRTRVALWRADDLSAAGRVWERDYAGFTFLPVRFLGPDRFARVEYAFRAGERMRYRAAVHDAATGEQLDALALETTFPHEWLSSPDGALLVVRNTYRIDVLRRDRPGEMVVRLTNDSRRHFTGLAFHPSGRALAAASNDATAKLYDAATGEARAFTWRLGKLRSVAFSADGTLAAAGTDKGQVVVWDVDL